MHSLCMLATVLDLIVCQFLTSWTAMVVAQFIKNMALHAEGLEFKSWLQQI